MNKYRTGTEMCYNALESSPKRKPKRTAKKRVKIVLHQDKKVKSKESETRYPGNKSERRKNLKCDCIDGTTVKEETMDLTHN